VYILRSIPNYFLILIPLFLLLSYGCEKKYTPATDTSTTLEESVKKGLWAYYTFNNGSFEDQSGNNHTLTGSKNLEVTYDLSGNLNEAIEFDGADDYAMIDAGKDFPDGDFSISFTIMPKRTTGTILQKANYDSNNGFSFSIGFDDVKNNGQFLFATNKNDDPCNTVFNTNTETTLYDTKTIFPDACYNVTIVYQDGEEQIYINAYNIANLKTPVKALKHCGTAPFYLGLPSAGDTRTFLGKMDNIRIYTRALTYNEVEFLYWAFR